MGTSASITLDRLVVEPGESVTNELTVRNTGRIVDAYRCEVLGDLAPWTTVEPAMVSLLPGGQGVMTVTVAPPRTSEVLAGEHVIALRVQPVEQSEHTLVEELLIDVLPFLELSGELMPQTTPARRWGRARVALDNRGNRPADVALEPGDPDQLVMFKMDPAPVRVLPGEAVFVPLRMRAKRRPLLGPPLVLPISVTAEPDDGDVALIPGAVQQMPRVPAWAVRAITFGGLGLIAALVAWFALLKPTLESTAREAIEDEVAIAADAADRADAVADAVGAMPPPLTPGQPEPEPPAPGAEPPASGAGPAADDAGAEGSAAAAAAAGGGGGGGGFGRIAFNGDPTDFRLQVRPPPGSTGQETFTVPERQTLSLTDIVLQNPQADVGTVQVRRGDGVLLEVRLENFRDLDYHFLAPIVYSEGQQVGLVVTCERQDGAACSAAGYFAGFVVEEPPEEG